MEHRSSPHLRAVAYGPTLLYFTRTSVRTADGDSESFEVKVGLHQGSVLSPLLFVIVMDVVTREVREGLPWELLYADDLVLMANSEVELKEKIVSWKASMEAKGLKMNAGKTKVMVGGIGKGVMEETGAWPCGVCGKGVGGNSILCTKCHRWVHGRCSGVKGKLQTKSTTFVCGRCLTGKRDDGADTEGLDIGNGVVLEKVGKFCYLGDMLNADGGADSAVIARTRSAWKKFNELAPLLTAKGISLTIKGKVYECCVRSCMVYGSETWPMKAEHEVKLERTEMSMIRRMCGVSLKDRITSVELREQIGIVAVGVVVRRNRLRWFGHVERKEEEDWVKRCTVFEVEGIGLKGRPRKTWGEVVRRDMQRLGLDRRDALDRGKWRGAIWRKLANPGKPG